MKTLLTAILFSILATNQVFALGRYLDKRLMTEDPYAKIKDCDNEVAPELEYVCELKVTCDTSYTVGKTAHGKRVIIPITGGTFEGPKMKGIVLNGGADYQLIETDSAGSSTGRTELEAIYSIRTDDGVTIHVRNVGLLVNNNGNWYFRTAPKFEAPEDSKYNWLNNAIFVCRPEGRKGYISLKVWMVK